MELFTKINYRISDRKMCKVERHDNLFVTYNIIDKIIKVINLNNVNYSCKYYKND